MRNSPGCGGLCIGSTDKPILLFADPLFPVSRLARRMCDSQNMYERRFDNVQNRIRKDVRQTTTNIFVDYSPAFRTIFNSCNRVLNFGCKSQAHSRLSVFIPVLRLHDILRVPPGEIHTSSAYGVTDNSKCLVARNRLDSTRPNFVASALRFRKP